MTSAMHFDHRLSLAALRIGQSQNEIAAKYLEIDRRPKRLKLVRQDRSAASCDIDVEETRL
jgi:hypothetical protein